MVKFNKAFPKEFFFGTDSKDDFQRIAWADIYGEVIEYNISGSNDNISNYYYYLWLTDFKGISGNSFFFS